MKVLSKSDLLQIPLKTKDVEIEGLGVIRLRELTGDTRDGFEQECMRRGQGSAGINTTTDITGIKSFLVSLAIVNENNELIFTDEDDIKKLNQVSAEILNRLWDAVRDMNGMTEASLEQAEKN